MHRLLALLLCGSLLAGGWSYAPLPSPVASAPAVASPLQSPHSSCCCPGGSCRMPNCPGNPTNASSKNSLQACLACSCTSPHSLPTLRTLGHARMPARPLLPLLHREQPIDFITPSSPPCGH